MYSRRTENPPSPLSVAESIDVVGQAHDKVVNNVGQGIALKRVLVESKQVRPIRPLPSSGRLQTTWEYRYKSKNQYGRNKECGVSL